MALVNCPECGKEISANAHACPNCGTPIKSKGETPTIIINNDNNNVAYAGGAQSMISSKSRLVALLLCFFGGWLGIHRFYAGKIGTAIVMIICMFFIVGEIWWFIDFIMIIAGGFKDSQGLAIKNW